MKTVKEVTWNVCITSRIGTDKAIYIDDAREVARCALPDTYK